jgi:hypothetical protein
LHSFLLKVGVVNTITSRTPGTPGFVHTKNNCPDSDAKRELLASQKKTFELYKTIVATQFARRWARPDVTSKTNNLAKFMRDLAA